jgi:hypothetical protein
MKHPDAVTNLQRSTPSTSAAPPASELAQVSRLHWPPGVGAPKEPEMSEGQPRPRLEVYYIVLRPFKYNGVLQEAGKEWLPAGMPFDGKLVASGRHVKRIEKVVEAAEAARRKPKPKEDEDEQ